MQLSQGTQSIIAGALFDFVGYLTTRPHTLKAGGHEPVYDVHDALMTWADTRKFDLVQAQPDHHWDKKSASITLETLVNEGAQTPSRIAGALLSFVAFCKVAETDDYEQAVLKFSTKTGLDISNPQGRWHAQYWA